MTAPTAIQDFGFLVRTATSFPAGPRRSALFLYRVTEILRNPNDLLIAEIPSGSPEIGGPSVRLDQPRASLRGFGRAAIETDQISWAVASWSVKSGTVGAWSLSLASGDPRSRLSRSPRLWTPILTITR